ncbi:uncharacterized protein LOC142321026 [Lycorma delicatula]|uniref:uncharacterized protein LOC142321026 n=1 Tax=Lycorma delicatula TaxID=130591 RepID=UPI003F517C94
MMFILKVAIFVITLMCLKCICNTRKLIRTEAVIRDDDCIIMYFKANVKHFCNETKITAIKEHTVRVSVNSKGIGSECNARLIEYLSHLLNASVTSFTITKGLRSKLKTVILGNTTLVVSKIISKFEKEVYRNHPEPENIAKIRLKG